MHKIFDLKIYVLQRSKLIAFLGALLLYPLNVHSQQNTIDSLLVLFKNSEDLDKKNELSKSIFYKLYEKDTTEATQFIDTYIKEVRERQDDQYLATLYGAKAFVNYRKGRYDRALELFDDGVKALPKTTQFQSGRHLLMIWRAKIFSATNREKEAREELIEILESEQIEPMDLGEAYFTYGNLEYRLSNVSEAIKYYQLCDSVFEKNKALALEKKPTTWGALLSNTARLFLTSDPDKAEKYFRKAHELNKASFDDAHAYEGAFAKDIGLVYLEKKEFAKAKQQMEKAIRLHKENKLTSETLMEFYNVLGKTELGVKDYENYSIAADSTIHYASLYSNRSYLMGGLYQKAEAEYYLKNPFEALEFLKRLDTLINKEESLAAKLDNQINSYDLYLRIYKDQGNFKKAYEYYDIFFSSYVKLDSIRNQQDVFETNQRYQTEKKEQQIALLESQNQLVEQQKANQRNILTVGLVGTSLLGIFFFILYRNRQRTNDKLKELDAFKTNLFTNISHELRTPLTLILGPIEKQLQDPDVSESVKEELSLVQHNSDRLLGLVDQMTDLAKVDSGQLRLQVSSGNLGLLLEQQLAAFQYRASKKQIALGHQLSDMGSAWYDADVMEKVTSNLLSNAIKYAPENSQVDVSGMIKDDWLHFSVSNTIDDAMGMDPNQWFDRFYQGDASANGMGVGLALVKELVSLHKGKVTVESNSESGITFTVSIPVSKESFTDEELAKTPSGDISTSLPIEKENTTSEDAAILLVVEDDPSIRDFVASLFRDDYTVVEASDGESGIEKAFDLIPDMIISDVMMPGLDGVSLTKTLKTDQRTSHIPIILLTAKVGDKDKLEGIASGADDYITKPFKNELLKAKVDKLITIRRQLQERYSHEIVLHPSEVTIPSTEEQFLNNLQATLNDKLIEPTFSVEELSASLGMSRMQLHRKLKALTGLSASEFIRSQRLKLAADLLKNSDAIVSQVGYAVGFNDPSYFTKCFKKQFGCTPSEYSAKH